MYEYEAGFDIKLYFSADNAYEAKKKLVKAIKEMHKISVLEDVGAEDITNAETDNPNSEDRGDWWDFVEDTINKYCC